MTVIGAVTLDDVHYYKAKIKTALGDDAGISELLGMDRHNFDFWVHRNGTIYISDNGQGGEGGVETDLNFFEMFAEFAPVQAPVDPQPDYGDIDASDSDEDPQPGDIYEGDDGKRYYVAHADGRPYEVFTDTSGNDYIVDPQQQSHWVGDY